MKDPILMLREMYHFTGWTHGEHKDHWPIRFFVRRHLMIGKHRRGHSKKWDMHTFYYVRDMRRLDKDAN